MTKMVTVRAIKRGTLSHTKGQFHFDPNGFPDAKKRNVPFEVAIEARNKGLVKIVRQRVVEDEDVQTVDVVAADRQEIQRERMLTDPSNRIADYFGAGGPGDTMATTHTQDDRTATANTGGGSAAGTDGVESIADDEDDDLDDDDLDDDLDDITSDADDAPPAGDGPSDQEIAEMGSSRERRTARRGHKPKAAADAAI